MRRLNALGTTRRFAPQARRSHRSRRDPVLSDVEAVFSLRRCVAASTQRSEIRDSLLYNASMQLRIHADRHAMSRAAAAHAARIIRNAIAARGAARIVAATGVSQIEFLDCWSSAGHRVAARGDVSSRRIRRHLRSIIQRASGDICWIGSSTKPASRAITCSTASAMPCALRTRLDASSRRLRWMSPLSGSARTAIWHSTIRLPISKPIQPYIIVALDEACRRQQVGEGWFATVDDVPTHAISMSVRQILKSREIICVVPEARKAHAVKACVEGEISPLAPASILRTARGRRLCSSTMTRRLLLATHRHRPDRSDSSPLQIHAIGRSTRPESRCAGV